MAFFPNEGNPTSAPPAPRLSQYNEENPIIHEQTVRDKSEGLENIAKSLGGVSSALAKHAENLAGEESNAMFVQSQAHLDTLKTNATVDIIKNPGQASQILDRAAEGYSAVTQDAVVNRVDRLKLANSAKNDLNQLRIDAMRAEVGVAKRSGAISFYETWPSLLSKVKSSIGNETEFNNNVRSAQELVASMVQSESISIKQGETYFASLQQSIDAAHQFMRSATDNTLTAKNYHSMTGGLASVNDGVSIGQPVDQNTRHLYEAQSLDLTKKTLQSDIAAGGNGSPQAWGALSSSMIDSSEMFYYAKGAHSVDAHINSGQSIAELSVREKQLSAKGTLNTEEQGEYDRIKNVMSDMGEGRTNMVLQNNPIYQEAEAQFNAVSAAIDASPLDPARKDALHQSYLNDLIWKRQSLMDAMHIPSEMQHPLPHDFVEGSKVAWGLNQQPSELISRLDLLQQNLKDYVARGQDTPIQQETTRIVANIKGGTIQNGWWSGNSRVTDGDRSDWVVGNQTNRDFSNLKFSTSTITNPGIGQAVQNAIPDVINFVARQQGGQSRTVAMIDSATNYVMYLAQKSGDFDLRNREAYISKAVSMVKAANPIVKGVNWSINPKDIPASPAEMDKVAQHHIDNAIHEAESVYGKDRISQVMGANSLSVVSTPTGGIMVIDAYGNKVSEARYNDRMADHADYVKEKKRIQASQPKNPENPENPAEQDEQQEQVIDDDIEQTDKLRAAGTRQAKKDKAKFEKAKKESQ